MPDPQSTPEPVLDERAQTIPNAVRYLQELSGRLWKEGAQIRSTAIGEVITELLTYQSATAAALTEALRERDEALDKLDATRGWPWAFVLQRDEDVSGVSGTGIVAEGVEFSEGTVVLRWTSEWPTSVVFHDRGIESVEAVHGHDGRTKIMFVPPRDASTPYKSALTEAEHRADLAERRNLLNPQSTEYVQELEHRAERAEALCDAYAKAYPAITLAEFDAKYSAELAPTDGPGGTE